MRASADDPIGVLPFNLGGPDTLADVEPFLVNLYEVDMLFGDEARAAGITNYRRTDALNSDPRFIEALATLVEQHVGDR